MLWVIIFCQKSIVKKETDVKSLTFDTVFRENRIFQQMGLKLQIRKEHLGSQLERSIDIKYI